MQVRPNPQSYRLLGKHSVMFETFPCNIQMNNAVVNKNSARLLKQLWNTIFPWIILEAITIFKSTFNQGFIQGRELFKVIKSVKKDVKGANLTGELRQGIFQGRGIFQVNTVFEKGKWY